MKRWRCPDCGAVHTARPEEYVPGFQFPRNMIFASVGRKLQGKTFLKGIHRQTQQYWLKALLFQSRLLENWTDLFKFFHTMVKTGQKPLTFRLNYRVIPSMNDPPYLDFAVTTR